MGQRGEIFSTRVFAEEGRKTYFFNVKENRYHDIYLNIVESRKSDNGFKRSSIIVFNEDVDKFLRDFKQSVSDLENGSLNEDLILSVSAGRRIYTFARSRRIKNALQIMEKREDVTGLRKEFVVVKLNEMISFTDGLFKAADKMKE
jgi:hypothetical protein